MLNQPLAARGMAWPVSTNTTWKKGYAATSLANCMMPMVTTETGWPTDGSITQDQQGKLLTNVYLSAAKLGWQNTFVYLLFDEPQAGNAGYGFFSQSDGTAKVQPKLLGTYTHNMTTILSDTSSNFSAGTVNYSVANEPNTVHDLLMEKSNGTYAGCSCTSHPGSISMTAAIRDRPSDYNQIVTR